MMTKQQGEEPDGDCFAYSSPIIPPEDKPIIPKYMLCENHGKFIRFLAVNTPSAKTHDEDKKYTFSGGSHQNKGVNDILRLRPKFVYNQQKILDGNDLSRGDRMMAFESPENPDSMEPQTKRTIRITPKDSPKESQIHHWPTVKVNKSRHNAAYQLAPFLCKSLSSKKSSSLCKKSSSLCKSKNLQLPSNFSLIVTQVENKDCLKICSKGQGQHSMIACGTSALTPSYHKTPSAASEQYPRIIDGHRVPTHSPSARAYKASQQFNYESSVRPRRVNQDRSLSVGRRFLITSSGIVTNRYVN